MPAEGRFDFDTDQDDGVDAKRTRRDGRGEGEARGGPDRRQGAVGGSGGSPAAGPATQQEDGGESNPPPSPPARTRLQQGVL